MREDVAAGRPANIIGIHLGTTNTVVVRLNEFGKAEITHNDEGCPITPSVIQVEDTGSVIIGSEAKKSLGTATPNVFSEFKREMGTDKSWPAGGRNVTPVELSALLLKKVVADYSEQYGAPDCIAITWPANFRNEQREATKKAAKVAGLSGVHFVERTTAAAVYYAVNSTMNGKYLVYDFGGGTFDVSLIEVYGKNVKVIYQDGVQQLGGKDLDKALLKIIGEKFRAKTGDQFDAVDCGFDKLALESSKHTLSNRPSVFVRLVSAKHGPIAIDVSRNEFETDISHLISQAEMACENVLRCGKDDPSQHITKSDIKAVFMVGGTSRAPAVKASVTKLFGDKVIMRDPHFDVPMGAAIYAGYMAKKEKFGEFASNALADIQVTAIAPHFIGTSVFSEDGAGLLNDTVIAKGTPLPCHAERTYYTRTDNQSAVNMDVTQSAIEERDPNFVTKLWEGSLKLPRDCPAGYPIKVTFSCDINGTISVDVVTGGDQGGPGVTAKLTRPGPTPLEQ
jgi:molecular chaperone DnaK (HSP70)